MQSRGLIFDLDDTLFPRERFVQSGLAAAARFAAGRYDIPADRAFTTMLAAPAGSAFQTLRKTFGLPADAVAALLSAFRTHKPSLWLFHDAEAALRQLRHEGWRLAVLTNGLPAVQAAKVEALGLRTMVDHVVFAAEHAEGGKPHAACFREVVQRLGLPADRCVMVGDDPACDVDGAKAAGIRTIQIVRTGEPQAGHADLVVKSLTDVPGAAGYLIAEVNAHAA
jgi:HAD superfamily hydrolase (TIGR01662 family)